MKAIKAWMCTCKMCETSCLISESEFESGRTCLTYNKGTFSRGYFVAESDYRKLMAVARAAREAKRKWRAKDLSCGIPPLPPIDPKDVHDIFNALSKLDEK